MPGAAATWGSPTGKCQHLYLTANADAPDTSCSHTVYTLLLLLLGQLHLDRNPPPPLAHPHPSKRRKNTDVSTQEKMQYKHRQHLSWLWK